MVKLKKELGKLEYLSLVSKVCTELDNHLQMDDKDLAKEGFKIFYEKERDYLYLVDHLKDDFVDLS